MADLILILILAAALLLGWRLGTIRVLAGLGAVVVAWQAARLYADALAAVLVGLLPQLDPASKEGQLLDFLALFIDPDALLIRLVQAIMFIVIFVLVRWLVRQLAYLLTTVMSGGLLGRLNRALGAFLSGVLAAVLLVVIHSLVLPVGAGLGLGTQAADFLDQSQLVLPLLYSVPQILSV